MVATALVRGNEVLAVYNERIPSGRLAPGLCVAGSPSIGWISGEYSIVPVIYEDEQPANSVQTGWTGIVSSNIAHIIRTWEPRPQVTVLQVSPLQFQARFTQAELTRIATAATSNPLLLMTLLKQAAAQYIDLTDQATIDGVGYLDSLDLLDGPERPAQILAPEVV